MISEINDAPEALHVALESEYGIALEFDCREKARSFRHNLYRYREAQRRVGVEQFDGLSFVIHDTNSRIELRIIKRKNSGVRRISPAEYRPLGLPETLKPIGARGRSRVGMGSLIWPMG